LQTTSSILRLPRILNAIDPYIESNLNAGEMIKLGALGFEAKAQEVTSIQLPPSKLLEETKRGGASVLAVDPDRLQDFIREEIERISEESVAPRDAAAGNAGAVKEG
jgi:anionic cell wall polymer biosynthesis LytR-Cps2A-Psr (LCP) family protein